MPEVSLVAILDADKEGLPALRRRSLIRTMGRAARNVGSKAILYGDKNHAVDGEAIGENRATSRERRRGTAAKARYHSAGAVNKSGRIHGAGAGNIARNQKRRGKAKGPFYGKSRNCRTGYDALQQKIRELEGQNDAARAKSGSLKKPRKNYATSCWLRGSCLSRRPDNVCRSPASHRYHGSREVSSAIVRAASRSGM